MNDKKTDGKPPTPAPAPTPDGRYRFNDVLLVEHVAAILRVREETVRRMARAGTLKPIPGCRHLRFSGSAVNRLLETGGIA